MSETSKNVALVVGVGATNGLGAAIARRFAREGYHVHVAGRSAEKLKPIVAELEKAGGEASYSSGDASQAHTAANFVSNAAAKGELSVVVYNAGQNLRESIFDVTAETFEAFWRSNTLGGFLVGKAAALVLRDKGRGSILFTGASGSLRGRSGFAAFAASKAGLRALSQSMARELGPLGLHVAHVIVDGGIEGERFLSRFPEEAAKRGADGLLKTDELAQTYWMLHNQHRSAWTQEIDLRPWAEPF
ncbi:SDR family NAD(P)-dependent oxidoreductase [Roseateles noduli]|uniref:SDR family NAD(P)-dependent oxidoreductase n=1 Tax=Roseateles noduli TaxID=2052484 RepID=UPI003D649ED2